MLKRNLLANYGGTGFVALTQLVLIPLYVRHLGETEWGILSVVVALSTALLVFETGVSLAVVRSFSALWAEESSPLMRLRWLERRYFAAAALLGVVALSATPWLGDAILPQEAGDAARLLALAVAVALAQIVGSLYRSVLLGCGAQVRFNLLLVGFTALRHAAGLIAAMQGGDAVAVTAAFAGGFILEALARRWAALTCLQRLQPSTQVARVASAVSLGALPLALAGAVGAFATQIDRLLLARMIDAATLGHYAIAVTLSLAALQLVYPISNALLPRLDRFRDDTERPQMLRRSYTMLVGLLLLVWLVATLLYAGGLRWWLDEERVSIAVAPLFLVHLTGTSLSALGVPLYLTLLAHRFDKGILACNMAAVGLQTAVLVLASPLYGAMAGSLSWCVLNIAVLVGYYTMLRTIKKDNGEDSADSTHAV
jgi:O-antigen/teichoic acid export membrane protein